MHEKWGLDFSDEFATADICILKVIIIFARLSVSNDTSGPFESSSARFSAQMLTYNRSSINPKDKYHTFDCVKLVWFCSFLFTIQLLKQNLGNRADFKGSIQSASFLVLKTTFKVFHHIRKIQYDIVGDKIIKAWIQNTVYIGFCDQPPS